MKRWWSNIVSGYLTFTKKERIAIFIAIAVIAIICIIPRFIKREQKQVEKEAFAQELAQLKITIDSSRPYKNYNNDDDDNESNYIRSNSYADNNYTKGELFNFDPNTLDANGWKRLGVRDKTAQTIQKLVSKGFKFRQPEDI